MNLIKLTHQGTKGEQTMIEKFDCITGTTAGISSKGTLVNLPEGKTGWIGKAYLHYGVRVMCTVSGVKEDGFVFLTLDSVLYQEAA